MSSVTLTAETDPQTHSRHCATCKRDETETPFGSDRYHCLSCIAARIRDWRRRKREAAAAAAQEDGAQLEAPSADTVVVEVVRTSLLSLRLEGYLADSGRSWLEVAREAAVDRAEVHRILMVASPTTDRPVADALMRAIGADPAQVPSIA